MIENLRHFHTLIFFIFFVMNLTEIASINFSLLIAPLSLRVDVWESKNFFCSFILWKSQASAFKRNIKNFLFHSIAWWSEESTRKEKRNWIAKMMYWSMRHEMIYEEFVVGWHLNYFDRNLLPFSCVFLFIFMM